MVTNRLLVKVWRVKVIVMRSQMEVKNMLSEIKRKVMFVTKWQRTSLNCLSFCVLWMVKLESNEIKYLMQEISKQSVKGAV